MVDFTGYTYNLVLEKLDYRKRNKFSQQENDQQSTSRPGDKGQELHILQAGLGLGLYIVQAGLRLGLHILQAGLGLGLHILQVGLN